MPPRLSNRPDPISQERFPIARGVQLGSELYNARSLDAMMAQGGPWSRLVPHTRQPMTPEQIALIKKLVRQNIRPHSVREAQIQAIRRNMSQGPRSFSAEQDAAVTKREVRKRAMLHNTSRRGEENGPRSFKPYTYTRAPGPDWAIKLWESMTPQERQAVSARFGGTGARPWNGLNPRERDEVRAFQRQRQMKAELEARALLAALRRGSH